MRFSERYGFKPVREVLQVEGMDPPLVNGLWTWLYLYLLRSDAERELRWSSHKAQAFIYRSWLRFFKRPIDELPQHVDVFTDWLRRWWFSDGTEWWFRYDLIEFVVQDAEIVSDEDRDEVAEDLNFALASERAAYRVVGRSLAQLTSDEQVEAIEKGLDDTSPFGGVHHHLRRALELMSSRTEPDFANSIKESVSSIESLCRLIVGHEKATLGDALKRLESAGVTIHPALQRSFNAVYGYASDEDGIRHAASRTPDVGLAEASYFLVSASAFNSYLLAKAAEAGISLEEAG